MVAGAELAMLRRTLAGRATRGVGRAFDQRETRRALSELPIAVNAAAMPLAVVVP